MGERARGRKEAGQRRRVIKEQLDGIRVEGAPDADRMMAAVEWLLYRRGPLAKSMRRLG